VFKPLPLLGLALLGVLISTSSYASGYTFLAGVAEATHIPEHTLTFAFVCVIVLAMGLVYKAKKNSSHNPIIPDKKFTIKNLFEAYGSFIMGQAKAVIGEEQGPKYFVFLASLFLIILISNLIGLVPGFLPPTENLNTTLALGTIAFVYYNIKGCKELGVKNYIAHFAGPLWWLAPLIFGIEILSNAVRPVSLALRLRGNLYGDHLVLGVFYDLFPALLPIVAMLLGTLVSFIQAYVFTVLTMVYISLAVAHHDHDEEHAH
jgi:F-type H+-transporting ATPase subunit a